MRIGLVWVGPGGALEREFELAEGATVADALARALREPGFAAAQLERCTVGVFGRLVTREAALHDGDRVEIYRGVAVDAKQARRARAARKGRSA